MSLAALPAELLDALLTPLTGSPAALANAALAGSALNVSATRLLYRHLSLSPFSRNLRAIHSLARNPRLAPFVRTFAVSLSCDDADSETNPLAIYKDIQRALRDMHNLADLSLFLDADASWVLTRSGRGKSPVRSLSPATAAFPRLEQFTCNFSLDAHLADFLAHTPLLRSLQLSSTTVLSPGGATTISVEPYHDLAPNSVPRLELFVGPASVLPALLTSRPLKFIHLSGDLTLNLLRRDGGDDDEELSVGQMGTGVQVISAMTSAAPAELLTALARAFPNVVCLRLMTTYAHWETPDTSFYARIAATLATLPNLAAFELSGMHWESRPKQSSVGASSSAEKEWVSPPVTPRGIAVDAAVALEADRDYDFDGAFLDWSY